MTMLVANHVVNDFKQEVAVYGLFVDAVWVYADEFWGFGATHAAFVTWVRRGFSVSCESCYDSTYAWPPAQYRTVDYVDCPHVFFPAGERSKALEIVKAIKMGLL